MAGIGCGHSHLQNKYFNGTGRTDSFGGHRSGPGDQKDGQLGASGGGDNGGIDQNTLETTHQELFKVRIYIIVTAYNHCNKYSSRANKSGSTIY